MYSVTQRIKFATQPQGGFIPVTKFCKHIYTDNIKINMQKYSGIYSPLIGLTVDYLSRYFFCGNTKEEAFDISLKGAKLSCELNIALELLELINKDDLNSTILAAIKLVCYDEAYRTGNFSGIITDVPDSLIDDIRILLDRCAIFFENYGPVVNTQCTFEGGYSALISSGDGDFLTNDTLWDMKCSKYNMTTQNSLQLAMYYLMGYNSIHNEFKNIKYLGIFNPILNTVWTVDINSISNKVFYDICHEILGYEMEYSYLFDWKTQVIECYSEKRKKQILYLSNYDNDFNPYEFDNGIYQISFDDYWSFYKRTYFGLQNERKPAFRYIDKIFLLKREKFIMFIGKQDKTNKIYILKGRQPRKCSYSMDFYYNNLENYCNKVLSLFSKYWNILYQISNTLKNATINESHLLSIYNEKDYLKRIFPNFKTYLQAMLDEMSFDGRVHGCIIDIDYYCHLYVNPYDGKITPYFAFSKYDKDVYKDIETLLKDRRPDLLSIYKNNSIGFKIKKLINTNVFSLADQNYAPKNSVFRNDSVKVYDTDIYDISLKLLSLQSIYDNNHITEWYDTICGMPYISKIEKRNLGLKKKQKCNMIAEIIKYRSFKDIDVQFEDGYILNHVSRQKWADGSLTHPNCKSIKKYNNRVKKSYVGRKQNMKCGLTAEVIEDFGCNDITIQFEDGLIRKHMRRDHFRTGTIGHIERKKDR